MTDKHMSSDSWFNNWLIWCSIKAENYIFELLYNITCHVAAHQNPNYRLSLISLVTRTQPKQKDIYTKNVTSQSGCKPVKGKIFPFSSFSVSLSVSSPDLSPETNLYRRHSHSDF